MFEFESYDVAFATAFFVLGVLFVRLRDLLQPQSAPGPEVPYADPVPCYSNRPRPTTWFINARGERLYYELRGPAPNDPACEGVLFVNVGYSAHCMRPHTGNFLDSLAAPSPSSGGKEGEEGGKAKAKGWCVASFDWAGSGYSQGVRCLYNGPDLVADLLQFVELVLSGADAPSPTGAQPKSSKRQQKAAAAANVPWVLCGHSMGGAVALCAGHEAWKKRAEGGSPPVYRNFAGCAVVAPLVTMSTPPAPVVTLLRAIAHFIPHASLPRAIVDKISDSATWVEEDMIKWHMTHDTWGVPGGLGWGLPVRWGSAAALIALSAKVQSLLQPAPPTAAAAASSSNTSRSGGITVSDGSSTGGSKSKKGKKGSSMDSGNNGSSNNSSSSNNNLLLGQFPVLALHDPKDEITQYAGSQLLVDRCGPQGRLVPMPGGRHDLFANQPAAVAKEIRAFVSTLTTTPTSSASSSKSRGKST